MKGRRILIFSRDPGGTNAVIPLIEPLKSLGNDVKVYGKDAALGIYQRAKVDCVDIREGIPSGSQSETIAFVQILRPDIILTGTSSEDFTERHLWKAAEMVGIPSFAVLDQWTNYLLRVVSEGSHPVTGPAASNLTVPSRFFIMDDFARKEMSALGIEREKLVVTGQPFFDYIRHAGDKYTVREIEKLRREFTGAADGCVIVFASQPIAAIHRKNGMAEDYWGYTETTILEKVKASLAKLTQELAVGVTLVLRLHPKDESNAYQDLCASCPDSIRIVVDRETDSTLLLKAADLVVGMFSMILLEAAILERPFISVQIGLKRESPLIFDRLGFMRSILTEKQLVESLRAILNRKPLECPNVEFQFGATEKITRYLEEYQWPN